MAIKVRKPPGASETGNFRALESFFQSLFRILDPVGTVTVDIGSIASGAVATFNVTVQGAMIDKQETVEVGAPSGINAGLMAWGVITAANTVQVRVHNTTGGAINPASGTWGVRVMR